MTSEEREARERRSREQHAANAAANGGGTIAERQSMLSDETRGDRGVTTTTIRLTPNNVFNV